MSEPKKHPKPSLPVRILAVFGTTLGILCLFVYAGVNIICKGPSPTARDLFVNSVMETSAAKFLAYLCYSGEEIAEIRARNTVVETAEVTEQTGFAQRDESIPKDTVELVDVTGPTFKGKMLIVHDPARVKVAVAPVFSEEASGVRVEDFAKQENAVAAINGGGFMDEGGVGKGGMPLGIVIKDGQLLNGGLSTAQSIVGFDENNQLVVGTMTGQECLDRGIRDAVSFGPTFIVNGKAMEVAGSGGGLNPRTVLGQRADGAVLMLVIDGRQSHSIGATYKDCIDVMLQYGAVNAANLDGGSSSMLVYNGEVQNVCASLYGSRPLPTAFIVAQPLDEGGN